MSVNAVLSFWFNDIEPSQWWTKNAEFDQIIKQKFLSLHNQAMRCELFHWRATPKGRLAEIIVLDQFSRNIFRGTPLAFASDNLALVLAQEAVATDIHEKLAPVERNFLLLPYMHSESLAIHEHAVELYKKYTDKAALSFELKHKQIIEEFGRYPHRNAILGRQNTPPESDFLKRPDSSF